MYSRNGIMSVFGPCFGLMCSRSSGLVLVLIMFALIVRTRVRAGCVFS